MRIPLVVVCAFLLSACGSGVSLGVSGPPSAKSVAASDSDFSGLQKCPESGSYDTYLKAEQTKDSTQYAMDKKTWDDMKAAGVNDSYVAAYAQDTSACGQFGSASATSKYVTVFAFRFKDSASASASYKAEAGSFHLSQTDITNIQALGGSVKQGASTGFGANSTVLTIDIQGTTVYVALWQKNGFEAGLLAYDLPLTADAQAATSINARIK